ncbi:hypothetical protein EAH79_12815 [Sphingomonas koreensis]|nr:hypothetical protein EAH79_12815 [Sphingomonas koreensis]
MTDLPLTLRRDFDGADLADKTGVSALLATVDAAERPHLAFLSVGEVLLAGDRLAITLWSKAQSLAALRARGAGALFASADGVVHELVLETDRIVDRDDAPFSIAIARLAGARVHAAPYATVDTLIGFTLKDRDATLARWAGQIAAMRAALAG